MHHVVTDCLNRVNSMDKPRKTLIRKSPTLHVKHTGTVTNIKNDFLICFHWHTFDLILLNRCKLWQDKSFSSGIFFRYFSLTIKLKQCFLWFQRNQPTQTFFRNTHTRKPRTGVTSTIHCYSVPKINTAPIFRAKIWHSAD